MGEGLGVTVTRGEMSCGARLGILEQRRGTYGQSGSAQMRRQCSTCGRTARLGIVGACADESVEYVDAAVHSSDVKRREPLQRHIW